MRLILLLSIVASLIPINMCSADLVGHDLQTHDNERCQRLASHYLNHGMTPQEAARLTRRHCKEANNGVWVSDKVYQA